MEADGRRLKMIKSFDKYFAFIILLAFGFGCLLLAGYNYFIVQGPKLGSLIAFIMGICLILISPKVKKEYRDNKK